MHKQQHMNHNSISCFSFWVVFCKTNICSLLA